MTGDTRAEATDSDPESATDTEALAEAFGAAFTAGDLQGVRRVVDPDARLWLNFDRRERTLEETLLALADLIQGGNTLAYNDIRRVSTNDRCVQQHTVRGTTAGGAQWAAEVCIVFHIRDNRITRVEEYLDPAQMAVDPADN